MKKKLIVLALTTFMFSIVACGNKEEEVLPKNTMPALQVASENEVEPTEETVTTDEPDDVKLEKETVNENKIDETDNIDEVTSSSNYETAISGYWINTTENAIAYINIANDTNTENTFKLYFSDYDKDIYKFAPFIVEDEHTLILGADNEEEVIYTIDGDRITIETEGCIIPFVRGTEEEYNEIFNKYYNA